MNEWLLVYEDFVPDQEGLRETLCTVGNGYFATRGAAPEARADDVHYPGTYVAGCYDRLSTEIAGRIVENEDLVNAPNWLPVTFRIDGGAWFDVASVALLQHRQELDMRRGVLARTVRFRDDRGRHSTLTQRRFVSMSEPHAAGMETTLLAEDWSGRVEVRSALDGRVTNAGVPRYRNLRGDHLVPLEQRAVGEDAIAVLVETRDSHIRIAEAARTRLLRDGEVHPVERRVVEEPGWIAHELAFELEAGESATAEKTVLLFTSRDLAVYEPGRQAGAQIGHLAAFDELLERHRAGWERLWRRFDIDVDGPERVQMILRLHVFHLLQTVSPNTIDLDVSVPARGLHGEAYRGHIFWDELFIFPFLNLRLPALTRSLLEYRHRRLAEATRAARDAGFDGAMFPWQSGSDGRDETQMVHLNPRSGRWVPDNSRMQRHVGLAVAYNLWQYFQVTGDVEFLRFHAGPILIEIARFFADLVSFDRVRDRYEIRGVMGPDEYHDAYPDDDSPGLNNNTYTNMMVVWLLSRAIELLDRLPEHQRQDLWENLSLSREELDRWEDISRKMVVPFHDGVISQFEGYERLAEFDWEGYRSRLGDIHRLDRVLEAEDDTPNRYKVSKQADVLMLFFLLSADELGELFARIGYELDPDTIPRTVDYYLTRTSHGSTLSRVVHAWVLARTDRKLSWELFAEALESDVEDVQGGTTAEGIHLGAMAGTVDLLQRGYSGLEVRGDVLGFNPSLPEEIAGLEFEVRYRGHRVLVRITHDLLHVSTLLSDVAPIRVRCREDVMELQPGGSAEWELER